MVNELLHGLYSKEYLATHTLAGGGGKEALDPDVVSKIIGSLNLESISYSSSTLC